MWLKLCDRELLHGQNKEECLLHEIWNIVILYRLFLRKINRKGNKKNISHLKSEIWYNLEYKKLSPELFEEYH